ncbi:rhodanese-like domain-containing protein [Salinibaculum rarum]|jgi:rhodanese-related sulfurtransferase|uniref:rhodanese-like domain-containing protein n=1 Tax=Salinibaculum rarum TaxID=3058903 RepID=UPI00265E1190|nr:rhodanese-like domain-containing protein [Salinibaculum sp. KK48]
MDGEIEPDRLETELDSDDDPLVVDIRNPPAFQQGHIPESVNVPLSQLTQRVDEIADADHVVTVCPHGQASVKAARLIASYDGFDGRVDSLHGGLTSWDGPLDTETADAPADEGPEAPF